MATILSLCLSLLFLFIFLFTSLSHRARFFSRRYKVEGSELMLCPHCVTRGVTRPTLFPIGACEALAAKGVWYTECHCVKIQFDKFIPDVALNDFWGYPPLFLLFIFMIFFAKLFHLSQISLLGVRI